MLFSNQALSLLALASICISQLVLPTHGHAFWVNIKKEEGVVELNFSEKAGLPDAAIQFVKDKIQNEEAFKFSALRFAENGSIRGRPDFLNIDWVLEDDRIVGTLPDMTQGSSMLVMGHLDFGPFNDYGMDVDDLQMQFTSNQLHHQHRDKLKIEAHQHMKEKPFYVGLDGCDEDITVTVHGLSSSLNDEEKDPISVCLYVLGGEEIGCQDVLKHHFADDDAAIVKFSKHWDASSTIFAKTKVMFPSSDGKGVAKIATTTAGYTPQCTN
jgi:hypothetical protein